MCGRFVLQHVDALITRFRIGMVEDFANEALFDQRFNIAPSQPIVTVVVNDDQSRALKQMRWGFQPAWFTPTSKRPPPINARAETLVDKPMWRGALAHGRCIIPADGFYEWMAVPGRKTKQPMHIRLTSGDVFGFAGLFTEDADGGSCAIITCGANDLMAPIHHRMPCILDPDDEARWLDPTMTDPAAVLSLLRPFPAAQMEAFPVSPAVSSARNEDAALIVPLF